MDCLQPPPILFRILTHSIHIFSAPAYLLALISLFLIKSNVFTTYRIFLIWHVLENLCFEIYSAWLVQPAVHPPYPLIRTTGLLSQLGISGLLQFYCISTAIEYNGISINEMFYFRYKASILNYRDHGFTNFLRASVYLTRFLAAFDPTFCALTFDDATDFQRSHKQVVILSDPESTFLSCSSVFQVFPFADYVSSVLTVTWFLQTVIPFVTVPGVVVYVNRNVEKSISPATWKLQQQLLYSLTIQSVIHGVMLGVPNVMFLYSFFFGYQDARLGYLAFLSLTYHGFVSTLAMIMFTRPLRGYISEGLNLKRKTSSRVSINDNIPNST